MRSKLKLGNIALLLASSAFALLLCELIGGFILNPLDPATSSIRIFQTGRLGHRVPEDLRNQL